MLRRAKPIEREREPLPIGTPLKGGAWAIAELLAKGGRHLQYKAMGRALRKAAVKEYFPPNWERTAEGLLPLENPVKELALRDFFRGALEMTRDIPSHPSMLMTYDILEERGTTYAAYEWHEGRNLAEIIRCKGSLPLEAALPIVLQVAAGLTHLHGHGFLHRDINPLNILVEANGRTRIADYETASPYPKTRSFPGMAIVNPDYAPIELLSIFPTNGPESDVYALAAVMYHMLTGRHPRPAASRVASPSLPPAHSVKPSIPDSISKALDRAMMVRAKDRTPTIESFLQDIVTSLEHCRS
jgi:serine/threonine protein kinase